MFVIKTFDRWAKRQDVGDSALVRAIDDADRGIIAAHLGDDIIKLRIAREGKASLVDSELSWHSERKRWRCT